MLPFLVGLNHPHTLWDPCNAGDVECAHYQVFQRRYGGNLTAAAAAQLQQYAEWGFNAAGYDSPPLHHAALPFLELTMPLDTDANDGSSSGPSCWKPDGHLLFPDPWNATVVKGATVGITRHCERTKPFRQNLIGYIFTDTPAFNITKTQMERGSDWVTAIRCLPDNSSPAPGRQAYTAFLKRRYGSENATRVCEAYGVPQAGSRCRSWDTVALDICAAGVRNVDHPTMLEDDYLFLPEIVEQYYGFASRAVRACDPAANILADTIRSPWTPDSIIRLIGKYADILSFQPDGAFFDAAEIDRLSRLSGLPVIIADIGFGWRRPAQTRYNNTEWTMYGNQTAAGAAYKTFVAGSAGSGKVLGLQKCQYIDQFLLQPEATLKPGMLDFDGSPHQPFTSLVVAANADAQRAFRGEK